MVQEARREELEVLKAMGVWERRPREECTQRFGKRPITLPWVDVNKCDFKEPKARSRLVATDLRTDSRPEFFAATPPLEYIRFLISQCARAQRTSLPTSIMAIDVKNAHFVADAVRGVYVELPEGERGDGTQVGLLRKSLYGTRDAALNWANTHSRVRVGKLGVVKGLSSPCCFYHRGRGLRIALHGDDFVVEGCIDELMQLRGELAGGCEIKWGIFGRDYGQIWQLRLLNRTLTLDDTCLTWDADPIHLDVIVEALGSHGGRGLKIPGVADVGGNKERHAKTCQKAHESGLNDEEYMDFDDDHDELGLASVYGVCDSVVVKGHGEGLIVGNGVLWVYWLLGSGIQKRDTVSLQN